jgi:hypothetical protein
VTNAHTSIPAPARAVERLRLRPGNLVTQATLELEAERCATSLDALILVNAKPSATGVQQEVAARGGVATVEPPPDEADVPTIQNGESTSVEAFLGTGVGTNEEASAGYRPARHLDAAPRKRSSAHSSRSLLLVPSISRRPSGHVRPPDQNRCRSYAVRGSSRLASPVTRPTATELGDPAQYDFQDGNKAAMVELKSAAPAPTLRLAAPHERLAAASFANEVS